MPEEPIVRRKPRLGDVGKIGKVRRVGGAMCLSIRAKGCCACQVFPVKRLRALCGKLKSITSSPVREREPGRGKGGCMHTLERQGRMLAGTTGCGVASGSRRFRSCVRAAGSVLRTSTDDAPRTGGL
jgi:hypothetical protein